MKVKLTKNVSVQHSNLMPRTSYKAGEIIDVIPADNLPESSDIKFWVNQDGWNENPYGFGIGADECEEIGEREQIFMTLESFISQRSGIEFREYASGYDDKNGIAAYNSDARTIAQQGRDARILLSFAKMTYITADELREGFKRGFSGRLSLIESKDGIRLEYCVGQYFPTEYRAAVCAVLASALWQYYKEPGKNGEDMRKMFKNFFGRGIQSRWFN